ncbi:MAG: GldG family protein [Alphaproteobacteria bacterium]|nr:GldG family protein [Alphaproteobacteria bacterium]
MALDPRRNLLANAWAQLGLVVVIVALANVLALGWFGRLDLTGDKLYSLSPTTRQLMSRVDKPLVAKVYFTGGLQAPYNTYEQTVVDKLEDLAAYSGGRMDVQVTDPTGVQALEEEARRFGITPVQYRFDSATLSEKRRVYMGVALVYGDRQQVLPAILQTDTLEYDLARAVRALVMEEERRVVGWVVGAGEPPITAESGPLARLRDKLVENHDLRVVPLGGPGGVPDDVDALLVVGPQQPLSQRSLYQLDQYVMRGGSLAVFLANMKPDIAAMRPVRVFHGMEGLLGHYGVTVHRDVLIDRQRNGKLELPVRQGRNVVRVPVDSPVIPRATELDRDNLVVKDLDSMLFPFASSLAVDEEQLPPELSVTVLAATHPDSGRLQGLRTLAPEALQARLSSEETGSFPVLVSVTGPQRSFFTGDPPPADPTLSPTQEDPVEPAPLAQGPAARLVVAGSADFVINEQDFLLNLVDWMVADEQLIAIRSKSLDLPPLDPIEPARASQLKLVNLLVGPVLLLVFGLSRWALRRRSGGYVGPAGGKAA